MQVRIMTIADIEAVLRNEERAYAYPWTRGMFLDCLRDGYQCWVALDEQEIIGHGILSLGAGEGHLLNLCIRRPSQGQGLGRRLADHLLNCAVQGGAEFLFLEVRPSNRPAVQLYESLGFREIGVRKDYYPAAMGHEDALIFALNLKHFAADNSV
jgi:ribosomal-protein-alanine N-acetyltransferase